MSPRVVIVGAGFGGMAVADGLKAAPVDITIVDRNNFSTFQPLLYQVATAGLNAADVAYPVRGLFRRQANLSFRQATVEGVDWEGHLLVLDDGVMAFDHLVIAAGATTNYFGLAGAEEHAFPLYGLRDAIRLRNHILNRFEVADADPLLIDDGALTFVVVGGGPTGVEVAGALVELIDSVLRKDFRDLETDRARVVLVEAVDHLLPPFSPQSRRHAREILERRGVEVRTATAVERVTATRIHFEGGNFLPSHTLIWAAGVKANPLVADLGLEAGSTGRIVVDADLGIVSQPGSFALGDIAASTTPDGEPLPLLAPVAIQAGRHVARQLQRRLDGRPTRPFHYRDKGTMATIGRRAAVAELPLGIKLQGTPAWFAWLGLHLVFLVGNRNRFSVLLNWGWNYLTWDRGPRLILDLIGAAPGVRRPDDHLEDERLAG